MFFINIIFKKCEIIFNKNEFEKFFIVKLVLKKLNYEIILVMDIWILVFFFEICLLVCNCFLILRYKGSLDIVDKFVKFVILGYFVKKNYVVIGDEEIVKLSIDYFFSF